MILTYCKSTEVETVIHADHDFATVAFLRIKNAVLESKSSNSAFDVQVPPSLEEPFIAVRDAVPGKSSGDTTVEQVEPSEGVEVINNLVCSKKIDRWVSVANIERRLVTPAGSISIEDEVKECFSALKGQPQRLLSFPYRS